MSRTSSKPLAMLLVLLPALAPGLALGQTLTKSAPVPVNTSPDTQEDPHVSGNFTAYTNWAGGARINYFNFATGVNAAVPNSTSGFDFLSDISGNTVVFSRVTAYAGIYVFDVVTGAGPTEVAPDPTVDRLAAAAGGATLAWQETRGGQTDIVVHDRSTGVTTRVTNDAAVDRDVSVAPSGRMISWTRCVAGACDIYRAVVDGTGAWVSSQVTGPEGQEGFSDTNGAIVVYDSLRGTEKDIYWKGADGIEHRLALPGEQKNPSISGTLIAFESIDRSLPGANWDILLHDISSGITHVLANSAADETLSDVWTDGAKGTVVYTVGRGTNADVWATHFQISRPCVPPVGGDDDDDDWRDNDDDDDHDSDDDVDDDHNEDDVRRGKANACADLSGRTRLAAVTLTRSTGKPQESAAAFVGNGEGLLCVENRGATAGWISVNATRALDPDGFEDRRPAFGTEVTLTGSNLLEARIGGRPGTSYTVTVYGPAQQCAPPPPEVTREDGMIDFARGTLVRGGVLQAQGPSAGGCSSSGGSNTAVIAALALVGLALIRPRARALVNPRQGRK